MESKFYNPDAWSRLIGKSNVVITYIDGQEVKTLLDTGAQISFMSEEYAKKRGFKIQPLEKLVNFTGANGLAIEYSGYVEVNLQLPNKGFNQDILILVVPHIEYHNFVPITLGTHTLEAIDEHLVTNNLVQNLETEWRLVHQAILYRQSLTKDHILGLVRATKNIIIQPFSCVNISGLVRTQKGGFSLHVVAEPSIQAKLPEGIALAGEQYLDITQGSSRVGLIFENQTEKPITIKERTILCQLVIGNLVPKLVAPKYDISELDRHFLEEEILTELDKKKVIHQMSQWIIMSSKRLLRIFPQPLLTVVKSQHKCPLCLALLQKRKRHLLKTTLMRMAVGFLIKLIFLVQKNLVKTITRKLRLCSLNTKTPLAELTWI